jgi:hypothetical protein
MARIQYDVEPDLPEPERTAQDYRAMAEDCLETDRQGQALVYAVLAVSVAAEEQGSRLASELSHLSVNVGG